METSPFHLGGYMICILEDSNPAVGLSLARFPPQRRSSVAAAGEAAAAVPPVPRQVEPADQEERHHRRLQGHHAGPGAGHQRQSPADLQQEDAGEIRPENAAGLPQGPPRGGAALARLAVPAHRAHRGRLREPVRGAEVPADRHGVFGWRRTVQSNPGPRRPSLHGKRGFRDHEEHRRGHPVSALNQHRPSGCQARESLIHLQKAQCHSQTH